MHKAANQRDLRYAVQRLARAEVSEADVSRAIDCFGQVLADLTETPMRLAVISGQAFEENNELRRQVESLKTEIRLMRGGIAEPAKARITFAGFNIVEDVSMGPGEIKAVCVNHQFHEVTAYCVLCGVRKV